MVLCAVDGPGMTSAGNGGVEVDLDQTETTPSENMYIVPIAGRTANEDIPRALAGVLLQECGNNSFRRLVA